MRSRARGVDGKFYSLSRNDRINPKSAISRAREKGSEEIVGLLMKKASRKWMKRVMDDLYEFFSW
jgi:hypothetical protein